MARRWPAGGESPATAAVATDCGSDSKFGGAARVWSPRSFLTFLARKLVIRGKQGPPAVRNRNSNPSSDLLLLGKGIWVT